MSLLATLALTRRYSGASGVQRLLARTFDARSSKGGWLLVALGTMPVVMWLSYFVQNVVGQPLPDVPFPWLPALLFFVLYFVGAIGEELGWAGYALPPLQQRHGALIASLLVGVAWWLWHIVPYLTMGSNLHWIVWQGVPTVAMRVLMVWIYNRAGQSVLSSILFHTMINVTYSVFPIEGSFYDPVMTGGLLAGLAVLVHVLDSRKGR